MMFLYFILFIMLGVVAYEDNSNRNGNLGEKLNLGDAPYFVAIRFKSEYICNGVILTKSLVLTSLGSNFFQELSQLSVVYGKTEFGSQITSAETKKVSEIITLKDNEKSKDYIRNNILSNIFVVKVDSPFNFGRNVGKIKLPNAEKTIPSNTGKILIRNKEDNRQILESQQFPPNSQKLRPNSIDMYSNDIPGKNKKLWQGSPFMIDSTLYGLMVVEAQNTGDPANLRYLMLLVNIQKVIDNISAVIKKNGD